MAEYGSSTEEDDDSEDFPGRLLHQVCSNNIYMWFLTFEISSNLNVFCQYIRMDAEYHQYIG